MAEVAELVAVSEVAWGVVLAVVSVVVPVMGVLEPAVVLAQVLVLVLELVVLHSVASCQVFSLQCFPSLH